MTVPAQPASGRSKFMKKRSLLTLTVTTALLVSLTLAGCGGKIIGVTSESTAKEESAAASAVDESAAASTAAESVTASSAAENVSASSAAEIEAASAAAENVSASVAEENVTASSAVESVSESAAEETVPAGKFEGIGADPNNIYNGQFTLGFDDEYIYYLDHAHKRVPYDGGEAEAISEILDSDPFFVNNWNGDIYFLTISGKVGTMLKKQTPPAFERTTVATIDGDTDPHSLLIVDGIAVIGYGKNRAGVAAVNLDTGEKHDLMQIGGFEKPCITVSDDMVYAFVSDSDYKIAVWAVSRAELMSGEMIQLTKARDFGVFRTMIFTPNGIHRIQQRSTTQERCYQEWLYRDIGEDLSWPSGRQLSAGESEWSEDVRPVITDRTAHFELDGNLFVFCQGKVYRYPGYDFSKHEAVADADVVSTDFTLEKQRFGVHDGAIYAIELDEEGVNGTIVKIYSDGTSERVAFTAPGE